MPLPRQILVPTDFSETAAAALEYSKTLAAAVGASLHVLHVMDDPLLGFKMPDHVCSIPAIRKLMEQEAGDQMSKVLTADEQKKFHARLTTVWGSPYLKIIEYAKEHDIDLIVMGSHGRGMIGHLLMGNVAELLCREIAARLKLKSRYDKPGTIQRVAGALVSVTDRAEAAIVGQMAVRYAVNGASDKMVTLLRGGDNPYSCTTGLVDLEAVANAEKLVPAEFINEAGNDVTRAFVEYARPLIGGPLPAYGYLQKVMVPKRLR